MTNVAFDPFRPRTEPAERLYEAFLAEAGQRRRRPGLTWIVREREAVHAAAVRAAEDMGLHAPSLADVEAAERLAIGHVDYAAKWAHGVAAAMVAVSREGQRVHGMPVHCAGY